MAEAPRFECHVGDCQKDCKRTKQRNLSNVLNIRHHVENESRTKVSFDVDARVARACVRARDANAYSPNVSVPNRTHKRVKGSIRWKSTVIIIAKNLKLSGKNAQALKKTV